MGAQKSKLGKAKLQELAQKTSCKYFLIVLPGVWVGEFDPEFSESWICRPKNFEQCSADILGYPSLL